MTLKRINVEGIFRSNGGSHAVQTGDILFCSGITARAADGSVAGVADIKRQVSYCFEKLSVVLAAAGCGPEDVIKLTSYVTSADHLATVSEYKREYFRASPPASTGLVVTRLARDTLLVELDVIATVPDTHST